MIVSLDHDLINNNTFGLHAHCSRFVQWQSVDEVKMWFAKPDNDAQPVLVIGQGSNLLLSKDVTGTVARCDIKCIEQNEVMLRCGAGEAWDDVVVYAVEHNLYGAENLSLIPGDVGAAAVQNIGAYGAEVSELIADIEAVERQSGRLVHISPDDCHYAYRYSRFKDEWKDRFIITHVSFRFSSSFEPRLDYGNIRKYLEDKQVTDVTPAALRQAVIEIRQSKLPDPMVTGNAGSFFMNPIVDRSVFENIRRQYPDMPFYMVDEAHIKIPAGWMIEQCGWKGRSLGRAGVHPKQALVLVNNGGATGQEIITLCHEVQRAVKEKFNIDIKPEVNII